jgi:hypothetical protein
MFVEESGHFGWVYVFAAFEEAAREDGDGVGMGLDEV